MKIIRCHECADVLGLARRWKDCACGMSGGGYLRDGDSAIVAGPCQLIGVPNGVLMGLRVEAFPYPEDNGKITRLPVNHGAFPERNAA